VVIEGGDGQRTAVLSMESAKNRSTLHGAMRREAAKKRTGRRNVHLCRRNCTQNERALAQKGKKRGKQVARGREGEFHTAYPGRTNRG